MSIYVVDTTVIMARILQETATVAATNLFDRLRDDDELSVPVFCRVECINVIWKQVAFRGMVASEAERLARFVDTLPLIVYTIDGLNNAALGLSIKNRLPIYDTLYIALALELQCPLITLDQKQAQAAQQANVTVKPLTDFAP